MAEVQTQWPEEIQKEELRRVSHLRAEDIVRALAKIVPEIESKKDECLKVVLAEFYWIHGIKE